MIKMKTEPMNMRMKGNRGSVLLSVLLLSVIFSLILLTMLPMMFGYLEKAVAEKNMRQAEFSARSVVVAVIGGLEQGNLELTAAVQGLTSVGSFVELNSIAFPGQTGMGTVAARITKSTGSFYLVVARAQVGDQSRDVAARISKMDIPKVFPQPMTSLVVGTMTTGSGGFIIDPAHDVAITQSLTITGNSSNSLGKSLILMDGATSKFVGSSNAIIADYIYTPTGYYSISGSSTLSLHGLSYTKNNSPLSSLNPVGSLTYSPYVLPLDNATRTSINTIPSWTTTRTGTVLTSPWTGPLNGGQYYQFTGTVTVPNLTSLYAPTVSSETPVYIILKTGSNVTITNAIDPSSSTSILEPRTYFILEGSASLTIARQSTVVVYSGTGPTDTATLNVSGTGTTLYGQFRVANLVNLGGTPITLDFVVPTGFTSSWMVDEYTNDQY